MTLSRTEATTALRDDFVNDTVHQPYTAFNQGFDAFVLGVNKDENPYPCGGTTFRWWEMGYESASDQG